MIGKDKIVFDPANAAETDNVGAYIRASDGTLITHTTDGAKQRLDVTVGAEYYRGNTAGATDKGMFVLGVDPSGNYAPLKLNSTGELLVDVTLVSGADKAEDAAAVSGDIGSYVLSVRQDVLATSTSADGDYQSFKTDSTGALWVHVSNPTSTATDDTLANAAATVGVAAAVITASLATRRRIIIQNVDNSKPIYLGTASVTTANGLRLSPGSALEIELAASTSIYAIAGSAGVLARVLETGHA